MDPHRLAKLCHASLTKTFVPEKDVAWGTPFDGVGSPLPDSMLSLAGTPEFERMGPERRRELACHELASMFSAFVRFESVINGYLARLSQRRPTSEATLPYVFHIVEEEARHSRMFARCIEELGTGAYPRRGLVGALEWLAARGIERRAATFYLGTLCVEEVTDRVLARALESDHLHPMVGDIARIHRIEESRHMDFVRDQLRETYDAAGPLERALVRVLAPVVALLVFELLLSPAVYRRTGLAGSNLQSWRLWWRARGSRQRSELRRFSVARIRDWLDDSGLIGGATRRLWAATGLVR